MDRGWKDFVNGPRQPALRRGGAARVCCGSLVLTVLIWAAPFLATAQEPPELTEPPALDDAGEPPAGEANAADAEAPRAVPEPTESGGAAAQPDDKPTAPDGELTRPDGAPVAPDGTGEPGTADADADGVAADSDEILPGVSGADFIGPEWEVGGKLPRRLTRFASVELARDDNVFSTGLSSRIKDDIVASLLVGTLYSIARSDEQQHYSGGAQVKLKAYVDQDQLTDFEGYLLGSARFEFYRFDLAFSDVLSRTVEPNDILDDRAPRLINRAAAGFTLHAVGMNLRVFGKHSLRQEDEAQFAFLDHTALTYGAELARQVRPHASVALNVTQTKIEYDSNLSLSSYEYLGFGASLSGFAPANEGFRYGLTLGFYSIGSIEGDPSVTISKPADTGVYVSGRLSWLSPDEKTLLSTTLARDATPSGLLTAANDVSAFQVVSSVKLELGRKIGERFSADVSVRFDDAARGALFSAPQRLTYATGLVWKINRSRQAYLRVQGTEKTSSSSFDDYSRLIVALGMNFAF